MLIHFFAFFHSKCVDIVVRVLELHARQWGHHPRPLSTSHLAPTPLNQYLFGSDVAEGESSAGAMPAGEAAFQAPVSNPGFHSDTKYYSHVHVHVHVYTVEPQ